MSRHETLVYRPCREHRITTEDKDGVISQTCERCGAEWFFEEQSPVTDAEMDEVADLLMEMLGV